MNIPATIHQLPALGYAMSALEPYIDERTMTLHHDQHHAAYVTALNEALASEPNAIRSKPAEWLLLNLHEVPEPIRTTVRRNVGGHLNHSLLWLAMTPHGGSAPSGAIGEAIDQSFGRLKNFQDRFEEAGSRQFGSGWVWLVHTRNGDRPLKIVTTAGHDNPLEQGLYPLLVNDVWEHAYYLKHQNRRNEFLHDFWSVVNWAEAGRRFDQAMQSIVLEAATPHQ